LPRHRSLRLAVVALAAAVLGVAAALAIREEALPSWVPEELTGLTIRPGSVSELPVTRDEAVAYARSRLFIVEDPSSEPMPDSFPVRVTGRVPPPNPAPLSPTGQVVLRHVDREPAWLVAWRALDEGLRSSPPKRTGELVDVVVLVDGRTGVLLYPIQFSSLES
jgi:hypothetical protein